MMKKIIITLTCIWMVLACIITMPIVYAKETPTGSPTATTDVEALKNALQKTIDALPDTTAEGFEVTSENVDDYTAQLQATSDAIVAYIQAGGNDANLDTARFDNLTAAVSAYRSDGGLMTMSAHTTLTATTMREWVVASINEAGIAGATASDEMTDLDLSNLMAAYYDELDEAGFWDSHTDRYNNMIPKNVTSPAGLSLYFHSAIDALVTIEFASDEVTSYLLADELDGENFESLGKQALFVPDEWDMNLYFNVSGVDVGPSQNGQYVDDTLTPPQQKTGEEISLIDAIPENVYLPVPIHVAQRDNVAEFSLMRKGSLKFQNYKDPTGATITRNPYLITLNVTDADAFLTSLSSNRTKGSISSFYATACISKVGSSGIPEASLQIQWFFDTPLSVKYSTSLEPITVGAENGLPTITGGTDTVPTASYMTEDDFNRPVNSATNMNRGNNSDDDTIGSNTSGDDIRGGTYTEGSGTDPDGISTHPIATGGTRTTRFSDYGYTSYTVSPNPAEGYAVDKYIVEVFNPVTNILESTEEYANDASDYRDSSATAAVNAYLTSGVKGKTKIYVAYKKVTPNTGVNDNRNSMYILLGFVCVISVGLLSKKRKATSTYRTQR